LTPPVALASMAASKVAMASFVETSIEAIKLVLPAFFVPFAFIYHPELLSFPNNTLAVFIPLLAVLAVQWNWSVVAYGFFGRKLKPHELIPFIVVLLIGTYFLFVPDRIYFYMLMAASVIEVILWIMMKRGITKN